MRLAQTLALSVAGGLLLAVVLFWATSINFTPTHFAPVGPLGTSATTQGQGFDPWTGQPHPETITWTVVATGEQTIYTFELPASTEGTRAIPVPVGFVVGCLLALGFIAIRRHVHLASPRVSAAP